MNKPVLVRCPPNNSIPDGADGLIEEAERMNAFFFYQHIIPKLRAGGVAEFIYQDGQLPVFLIDVFKGPVEVRGFEYLHDIVNNADGYEEGAQDD